jgi:dUTP pyrophosphatase
MILLLKRLSDRALRPSRSYPDDAGLDLYITDDIALGPGEFRDIDTGWAIKIADGYWGSVKARSSTFFKRGLIVHEGTIDTGYTGKLSIGVYNPGQHWREIKMGERLAQLVILPLIIHDIEIVNELPTTVRGEKGFGSTGIGRT